MSIKEGDRTDQSRVINLIPIERKKNTKGPFKSGSFANVSRVDITRGITETSREYVAEKTREQLRGVAASAANTDISSIRDTMLHLESIMAKNTAARLDLVTNAIDAKEAEEDRLGRLGFTTGGAGFDTFGLLMLHPTKSGGPSWFSTSWNGNPRTLTEGGGSDPHDARVSYSNGDPDTTPFTIVGDGMAYVEEPNMQTSARLYVSDTWVNTEQTIEIWIEETDDTLTDIQARSRSRHQTSCSFGNYLAIWRDHTHGAPAGEDLTIKYAAMEVEPLHPFYIRNLGKRDFPAGLPRNQWIGLKLVTRTRTEGLATPDVVCESYINYDVENQSPSSWVETSSYEFSQLLSIPSGWMEEEEITMCAGLGDGTADKIIANDTEVFAYLGSGNMCWWRVNNIKLCWFRHASIREIDPLP